MPFSATNYSEAEISPHGPEATLISFEFSRFEKGATPSAKRPAMTIQSNGALVLNGPAHRLMGAPAAVELLYDEVHAVIGLRTLPSDDPAAHPVRSSGKGTMFSVAGATFLRYFDIPFGDPVNRDVWIADDDVLVLDLNDPGRAATSSRRRERIEDLASRLVQEMNGARRRKRSTAS